MRNGANEIVQYHEIQNVFYKLKFKETKMHFVFLDDTFLLGNNGTVVLFFLIL